MYYILYKTDEKGILFIKIYKSQKSHSIALSEFINRGFIIVEAGYQEVSD